MRPVLPPSARPLWRDGSTVQLGRSPGRAVAVAGLDPATRSVLGLLDGTRDREQVRAAARAAGCPPDRTDALLAILAQAGVLDDGDDGPGALAGLDRAERERMSADVASLALVRGDGGLPAVRSRQAAQVLVVGGGRVGAPLAALLATAGVGAVDVSDDGRARPQDSGVGGLVLADAGRSRGEAAREAVLRASPSTDVGVQPRPDLVVLAPTAPDRVDEAPALLADGLPHLVAQVRGEVGVVGPLVVPGRSACLHCLDLTRTDLDPAWPALAAQLAAPARAPVPCDGALALMVAAQAALQVLALVDGTTTPATVGGTLELALPDWRWRRRSWAQHPGCGCAWHGSR